MVCSKFFYCCLLSKFIFINVKYHFNFQPYLETIKDQILKNVKYPTPQEYQNYSEQVLRKLQPEKMEELKQAKQWEIVYQNAVYQFYFNLN